MHGQLRKTAAGAALAVALMAAPPAVGQTSAQGGYSEPSGSVQQQVGGASDVARAKAVRSSVSSGLPFTGLDIALVLAAGGVLILMGTSIRRLSRPRA